MANTEVKYRLKFNNGTVLEDCQCGCYENSVDCLLNGISFGQAYFYFDDVNKYSSITFEIEEPYFIDRTTHSGINRLVSITQRKNYVEVYAEGDNIITTHERVLKEVDESDATVHNSDLHQS